MPTYIFNSDFDSFVAFDLETTGLSSKIDSIIEIGAVKVVNGKVIESAEFTFQELVKPLDGKKVSPQITDITGIKDCEVQCARHISEVFPDFMKFVGDNILVGYNCNAFDSKFMVRAGRYSNYIVNNPYFDVMWYVDENHAKIGLPAGRNKLSAVAEKMKVVNPRAHRALADAITTARVFLEIKKRV